MVKILVKANVNRMEYLGGENGKIPPFVLEMVIKDSMRVTRRNAPILFEKLIANNFKVIVWKKIILAAIIYRKNSN